MSINSHVSRISLVALLAAAPFAGFAQTATVAPPADGSAAPVDGTMAPVDGTAAPADGTMAPVDGTVAPVDSTMAPADGTTADTAPVAEPEQPAAPVAGQIIMQGDNTALATDLIGTSVYSTSGETIGNISDIIINLDGAVDGVVIGVGGFLGLGKKLVAIETAELSIITNENGEARLQSSARREDLEAAPEFVTKAEQLAAERAAQPPASVDTTAPVDGMPPADGVAPAADGTAPAAGN